MSYKKVDNYQLSEASSYVEDGSNFEYKQFKFT
jgi:hypothetical protein